MTTNSEGSKKSAELEIVASKKFMNARREHISAFDRLLNEHDTILGFS
jgi:hypothetical protein